MALGMTDVTLRLCTLVVWNASLMIYGCEGADVSEGWVIPVRPVSIKRATAIENRTSQDKCKQRHIESYDQYDFARWPSLGARSVGPSDMGYTTYSHISCSQQTQASACFPLLSATRKCYQQITPAPPPPPPAKWRGGGVLPEEGRQLS